MRSSFFDSFVVFIIIIKVLFIIFAGMEIYFKIEDKLNTPMSLWAKYWKERLEFIFIISMAIICIVLFNPYYSGVLVIDRHVRLLIFLYGIIILITSNWKTFFGEMPAWFKMLQRIV